MGPDAVAIIPGAGLVNRSADTHYRFRQNSDFWYLTGFNHPDATAVLSTVPETPTYRLFVQPRDPTAEIWTGYRPGVEGAVADYGADGAGDCGSLAAELPELVAGATRLYHALGRRPDLDRTLIETQAQYVGALGGYHVAVTQIEGLIGQRLNDFTDREPAVRKEASNGIVQD